MPKKLLFCKKCHRRIVTGENTGSQKKVDPERGFNKCVCDKNIITVIHRNGSLPKKHKMTAFLNSV